MRLNRSVAVVLPKDWTRWNGVEPGDLLDIEYDGAVHVRPKQKEKGVSDGVNPDEHSPG